jgi:hypothetical protein
MRVALLVLALGGCSFAFTSPPARRDPCPTSPIAPSLDAAVAVGSLVASIAIVATGGENYAESNASAYASVAGVGAALFALAATRGFQNVSACRDHQRDLDRERLAARTPVAPSPSRLTAWDMTKHAAAAARNGDCATVLGVDRALVELDREFRDTVFARDVAIARCLTQPASAPQ